MAVYRNIQISFWQDPFVLDLTPEEKYFYIYLMTNSKTTQCGIYQVSKKIICLETGYNIETVDKLINRFQDYKKIKYCSDHNEVFLLNWIKHNPVNNVNIRKCVFKELELVKSKDLVRDFKEVNKGLINGLDTPTKKKEEEKEKEKEEEKEEEKAPSSDLEKLKDDLHNLMNKCNIQKMNLHSLELILSYLGMVEPEIIEAAIKKGEGKHINYVLSTLEGMYKEGITKKEQLYQKPTPGKPIKQDKLPFEEQAKQDAMKPKTESEEEKRKKSEELLKALGEWEEPNEPNQT
jgi:hypothetical protein